MLVPSCASHTNVIVKSAMACPPDQFGINGLLCINSAQIELFHLKTKHNKITNLCVYLSVQKYKCVHDFWEINMIMKGLELFPAVNRGYVTQRPDTCTQEPFTRFVDKIVFVVHINFWKKRKKVCQCLCENELRIVFIIGGILFLLFVWYSTCMSQFHYICCM